MIGRGTPSLHVKTGHFSSSSSSFHIYYSSSSLIAPPSSQTLQKKKEKGPQEPSGGGRCINASFFSIDVFTLDGGISSVSSFLLLFPFPTVQSAQERREMWLITVVVLAALHKDSCNPLLYCWKMSIFSTPTRVMMKNKRLVSLAKTFPVFPSIVSDKFVSRKRSLLARDGYFVKRMCLFCNFKEHTTVSQIANRSITFASWGLISFHFLMIPFYF